MVDERNASDNCFGLKNIAQFDNLADSDRMLMRTILSIIRVTNNSCCHLVVNLATVIEPLDDWISILSLIKSLDRLYSKRIRLSCPDHI